MTEQVEPVVEDLQLMVRAAWETVLEHEEFGPDADFFAVGGNSFLVAKVMAGLSREVGARLPMRLFFAIPTVRGVGQAITEYLEQR
ncbi:MAG: acyl carrier protein [Streptomyces sp.]|nr:acyl carrier protein [Streptomyces sp.]